MTKLKQPQGWSNKSRTEKLSAILYPNQTDDDTRKQMAESAAYEKRKVPSGPGLLKDSSRGCVSPIGGTAKTK